MAIDPIQLSVLLPHLAIDAHAPAPLVVSGAASAWDQAAVSLHEHAGALASIPTATIALVAGPPSPSPSLDAALAPFDFVGTGTPAELGELERGLRAGLGRAPQAAAVLVALTRAATPSLLAESLAYSLLQGGREHAAWLAARPPRRTSEPGARVRATLDGARGEIVLTRPVRRNALDARMREELCDALDVLAPLPGVTIAIRGEGPSFCAGGDLDEFGTREDPVAAHVVRASRSVAQRLRALRDRVTVAVQGDCVGAGVELAAFAGRLSATADATFALPELGFGLIPGAGGTVSVPERIGRRRFLEWVVTGRRIDAPTALRWGLIDAIAPAGDAGAP